MKIETLDCSLRPRHPNWRRTMRSLKLVAAPIDYVTIKEQRQDRDQ
jgi:hypothetical protein